MVFSPFMAMLQLNFTQSDIEKIYKKLDVHFENMDYVIENALEIVEKYEKQIFSKN